MATYIELLRPINCLMAVIAVFIGGLLVVPNFSIFGMNLLFAALAVFLISGGGFAINDYFDVDADRINRPNRPIPSGRISKKGVLSYSILLFAAGIFFSIFLTGSAIMLAVINSILLILYSWSLQNKVYLGNAAVSYMVGSTFLFGGAAFGNLTLPFTLFLVAAFSNMAREIAKDIEDLEGDKKGVLKRLSKLKTYTAERFGFTSKGVQLKYKKKNAVLIASISLLITIAVSPLPFLLNILGLAYLMVLVPTDIVFVYTLFLIARADSKRDYARVSKAIKIGMFLGLIAFLVGVFF